MKLEQVITITGIRPDFIRMSEIFRKFDENYEHIMIHTGQHYNDELSQIFFKDLNIRQPDYTLDTGKCSTNHYEQLSYLSVELPRLIKRYNLQPDMIFFLGDSNSVVSSLPLFKEGYRIAHIEGGMRSYDRRMFEEVNRVVCDYVSDEVFVYTPLYKERLMAENKLSSKIHVVGNTMVEIVNKHWPKEKQIERRKDYILADIHRNEVLSDVSKYVHLLEYLNKLGEVLELPVKLVRFNRGEKIIGSCDLLRSLPNVELVGPYGFLDYLDLQYHAFGVVSDSGTCQEECPLLGVPAVVPRNYTERPESEWNRCSLVIGENKSIEYMVEATKRFFLNYDQDKISLHWLGDGKTAQHIVNILNEKYS